MREVTLSVFWLGFAGALLGLAGVSWALPRGIPGLTSADWRLVGRGGLHGGRGDGAITHPDAQLAAWR